MFMRQSYVKFASTTELHGFDQVLKYSKFWAALWLCLTIVACCMCTNDVINLVITYQSEPTIISLKLTPNLNMILPNPTLCMEVAVESMGDYNYSNIEYIDADLQAFLLATNNAENLNISDRDQLGLSDNLQYFTYLMLGYITEAELSYMGYNNNLLTTFVTNFPLDGRWYTDTFNTTIAHLYQRYMSHIVSLANLKRLIGMSVCQQRTDKLTRYVGNYIVNGSSKICNPHKITHLSFSMVCSKLLEDNENLASYSKVTLNGTRVSLLDGESSSQPFVKRFDSPEVTFSWHLDIRGRPMLPVESRQDIYSWNPYYGRAFAVTVAAEYRFYSTNRYPCQDTKLQYDCDLKNRIDLMQRKCECRPSSLLFGVTNAKLPKCSENPLKPVCAITNDTTNNFRYLNFTGICGLQAADHLTLPSCVRNCRLIIYHLEYSQPSYRLLQGMAQNHDSTEPRILPSGVLEITPNMGKSRQFVEERPAKDFSTFISDFGGSLGAWLGASLLALIHAAIHIVLTFRDAGKQLAGIKKKIKLTPETNSRTK